MTDSERLASLETKVDDVRDTLTEVRGDIKAMGKSCASCGAVIAGQEARISALEKGERVKSVEDSLNVLWSRYWWAVGLIASAIIAIGIKIFDKAL
jgi:hypothetical protein